MEQKVQLLQREHPHTPRWEVRHALDGAGGDISHATAILLAQQHDPPHADPEVRPPSWGTLVLL